MNETDALLAAFMERLPARARLMGIDLGTKTIGLALSDVECRIATPLETIKRVKFTPDVAKITTLVERFDVGGLVIGLPLNMDGSEGPRAQSTRAFVRNLAPLLARPVLFWDERLVRAELRSGIAGPRFACSCSRERVGAMLKGLGRAEIDGILAEQGKVEIGCEFCGAKYRYDPVDVGELFTPVTVGLVGADYFRKHPGRFNSMHLQDVDMDVPSDGKRPQVALGQGSIDWPATFAAAKAAGVKNYFVEQNWELTRQSVAYLKTLEV